MKKTLFIVSVFIFTSISLFYLNASDIKTALADERMYGPSISDDIIIAIKFEGTPSSASGIHPYKEIQEDAIISAADLPLTGEDKIVEYPKSKRAQAVNISGIELKDVSEWVKVVSREPSTATAGRLTISAYSKQYTPGYTQIFRWVCDQACLNNFSASDGNADFTVVGGNVEWVSRVKTVTHRPDSTDTAVKWNLSDTKDKGQL